MKKILFLIIEMLIYLYIYEKLSHDNNVKIILHYRGKHMKKIFTKADEMEMTVNYKAARNTFAFLEAGLAVYCLIYSLKTGELPWIWLIFVCSGVVFWTTKWVETRRLTASGDPDEE